MAEGADVTTIDPLNLALKANTVKARIWWWFVTIVDVIVLIGLIAVLVNTYNKNETSVVTMLTQNRLPFPAVTFCNMNPYKKSALASMPEVAKLVDIYNKASQTNNTNKTNNTMVENKKRRKRQLSCSCSSNGWKSMTYFGSKSAYAKSYVIYYGMSVTWACAFTCCSSKAPAGNSSRLARFTSVPSDLLDYFDKIDNTTNATTPRWVDLYGTNSIYSWYDDASTSLNQSVNVASLCPQCVMDTAWTGWAAGGPVTVKKTVANVTIFQNWEPNVLNVPICEYFPGPVTTSTSTTASIISTITSITTSTTETTATTSPLSLATTSSSMLPAGTTSKSTTATEISTITSMTAATTKTTAELTTASTLASTLLSTLFTTTLTSTTISEIKTPTTTSTTTAGPITTLSEVSATSSSTPFAKTTSALATPETTVSTTSPTISVSTFTSSNPPTTILASLTSGTQSPSSVAATEASLTSLTTSNSVPISADITSAISSTPTTVSTETVAATTASNIVSQSTSAERGSTLSIASTMNPIAAATTTHINILTSISELPLGSTSVVSATLSKIPTSLPVLTIRVCCSASVSSSSVPTPSDTTVITPTSASSFATTLANTPTTLASTTSTTLDALTSAVSSASIATSLVPETDKTTIFSRLSTTIIPVDETTVTTDFVSILDTTSHEITGPTSASFLFTSDSTTQPVASPTTSSTSTTTQPILTPTVALTFSSAFPTTLSEKIATSALSASLSSDTVSTSFTSDTVLLLLTSTTPTLTSSPGLKSETTTITITTTALEAKSSMLTNLFSSTTSSLATNDLYTSHTTLQNATHYESSVKPSEILTTSSVMSNLTSLYVSQSETIQFQTTAASAQALTNIETSAFTLATSDTHDTTLDNSALLSSFKTAETMSNNPTASTGTFETFSKSLTFVTSLPMQNTSVVNATDSTKVEAATASTTKADLALFSSSALQTSPHQNEPIAFTGTTNSDTVSKSVTTKTAVLSATSIQNTPMIVATDFTELETASTASTVPTELPLHSSGTSQNLLHSDTTIQSNSTVNVDTALQSVTTKTATNTDMSTPNNGEPPQITITTIDMAANNFSMSQNLLLTSLARDSTPATVSASINTEYQIKETNLPVSYNTDLTFPTSISVPDAIIQNVTSNILSSIDQSKNDKTSAVLFSQSQNHFTQISTLVPVTETPDTASGAILRSASTDPLSPSPLSTIAEDVANAENASNSPIETTLANIISGSTSVNRTTVLINATTPIFKTANKTEESFFTITSAVTFTPEKVNRSFSDIFSNRSNDGATTVEMNKQKNDLESSTPFALVNNRETIASNYSLATMLNNLKEKAAPATSDTLAFMLTASSQSDEDMNSFTLATNNLFSEPIRSTVEQVQENVEALISSPVSSNNFAETTITRNNDNDKTGASGNISKSALSSQSNNTNESGNNQNSLPKPQNTFTTNSATPDSNIYAISMLTPDTKSNADINSGSFATNNFAGAGNNDKTNDATKPSDDIDYRTLRGQANNTNRSDGDQNSSIDMQNITEHSMASIDGLTTKDAKVNNNVGGLSVASTESSSRELTKEKNNNINNSADAAYMEKELANVTSDNNALSATSQDILPYITASLSKEDAIKAGYTLSESVMRCSYNSIPCLDGDFKLNVDPNYGNCYTYNAQGKRFVANQAGKDKGLSVIYHVREDNYLDFIQTSGLRVIIHKQQDAVFPDTAGFSVPTGYRSTAAMKQIHLTTTKSCAISATDVPTYNYVNISYSTEACLRSCYQKEVIEKCQCGDPRIPMPLNSEFGHCTVPKRDCVNIYYSVDDVSAICNCPRECKTDIYETSLSMTKWSKTQQSQLKSLFGFNESSRNNGGNQLAKIDIYFEQLIMVEYAEMRAYGITCVMWDVSQVVGLFLGVSVMSVFEIFDLASYLLKILR